MIWQWMRNGFFHVSAQIARDWTGFWGFDGISCVYLTFSGVWMGRGNDDESLPLRLPVAQRASFGVEVDADLLLLYFMQ